MKHSDNLFDPEKNNWGIRFFLVDYLLYISFLILYTHDTLFLIGHILNIQLFLCSIHLVLIFYFCSILKEVNIGRPFTDSTELR